MTYRIAWSRVKKCQGASTFLTDAMGDACDVAETLHAGFPYLVDERTHEPFAPALSYLTSASMNGTRSLTTAKNKADHLYEWMLYLHTLGVDFRTIRLPEIQRYGERCAAYISPTTRAPLEAGTIRGRLGTILDFYRFAETQGWVPNGTIPKMTPKAPGAGQYRDRHARSVLSEIIPVSRSRLIEHITDENLKRIFGSLNSSANTSEQTRDWLIALFCVTTGARIFETLALTVHQILEFFLRLQSDPREKLRLHQTKGGVPRDIAVPLEVVTYLIAYMDGERSRTISEATKSKALRKDHNKLFVNSLFAPQPWIGHPYKEKRSEEAFATAQENIGLLRKVPIFDPGTRTIVGTRESPLHVLHHLRHTYAVRAWYAYSHLPADDRWIKIQLQLGHTNHHTTSRIYLRAVRAYEASARDSYGGALKLLAELET